MRTVVPSLQETIAQFAMAPFSRLPSLVVPNAQIYPEAAASMTGGDPSREETVAIIADLPHGLHVDLQKLTNKHARAIALPEKATPEEMKRCETDFRAPLKIPDHPKNKWGHPVWRGDGDFETALSCGSTGATILLQFQGRTVGSHSRSTATSLQPRKERNRRGTTQSEFSSSRRNPRT